VNDQHGKQMTTSMCMYARSSDLISSGPIHTVQLRVLNMLLRMLKLTTLPWRACLWGGGVTAAPPGIKVFLRCCPLCTTG